MQKDLAKARQTVARELGEAACIDRDMAVDALVVHAVQRADWLLDHGDPRVQAALCGMIIGAEIRRHGKLEVSGTVAHVDAATVLEQLEQRIARLAPLEPPRVIEAETVPED